MCRKLSGTVFNFDNDRDGSLILAGMYMKYSIMIMAFQYSGKSIALLKLRCWTWRKIINKKITDRYDSPASARGSRGNAFHLRKNFYNFYIKFNYRITMVHLLNNQYFAQNFQ